MKISDAQGNLHAGEVPALGVNFDQAAAARLPYSPAVNRLEDGTVQPC